VPSRSRARFSAGGVSGPYEQLVALDVARSVTSYTLGPAEVARGFDGSVAWQRSPTAEVGVEDSEAGQRAASTEAYLNARGYLLHSRWNSTTEALGMRSENGRSFDVIRVVPLCGQPVELWFDRDTHPPYRSSFSTTSGSCICATLDGIAGQFWLDTGNRNALTLGAPLVEAHQLATRYAATPDTTIGWGIGGSATGRVARGGT
jgi:hypothetical protein